jgi:hypothetical protein
MTTPYEPLKLAPADRADADFPTRAQSSEGTCAAPAAAVTPIGALLARHILRDGEIVLLVLKPSLWFVLLTSLRFIAIVTILALAAIAWEGRHNREWFYIEAALFLIAGRIMWAVLAWMGRLYVLTDLRIIRLSGVFKVDIFDCALRKVAKTQVTTGLKERLTATGSIEITPEDESIPPGVWQTVCKPREVLDLINRTIAKAKHHGLGAAA